MARYVKLSVARYFLTLQVAGTLSFIATDRSITSTAYMHVAYELLLFKSPIVFGLFQK